MLVVLLTRARRGLHVRFAIGIDFADSTVSHQLGQLSTDLMVFRSGSGRRNCSEPFDIGIQLTERFDTESDRPIEAHGIAICLGFDQVAGILGLNPADQGSTDTSAL